MKEAQGEVEEGESPRTSRWPRETVDACVDRLSISREAAELFAASCVIDLHVDSFIWQRVLGYRLDQRHGPGPLNARYSSQVDLPRLRQVGVNAATWVITTNPFKSSKGRSRAFERNLRRLEETLDAHPGDVVRVSTATELERVWREGRHAALVGVQGGNAFSADLELLDRIESQRLLRVTLTHLTNSWLGHTSFPAAGGAGHLTAHGAEVVRRLNQKRIFVDLAHIHERGFFEALEVHDPTLPPIVTHTGVSGVHPHWRNLTDAQLRAIADRQGTVGIMYHTPYLAKGLRRASLECVAAHIEHVIKVVGDDFVSLGSDWDGAITTPVDMPTCLELPRLVDALLHRGMQTDSIQKLLGLNFLRTLRALRG